ncbi:hypothetical protein CC85DRAFT_283380 [Cutaneotrichosporon oleaginosum]|uniref:DUF4211 domain-containing protein n=1 Tax=Cutaneotrichosporon oleaginosum TaxID=879819 RepID=A0A0J1BA37_9TREE|nr:uncharacterized protein CC85DRAFT_283380 [Cutaneotrichosporon oleaginosum]KLT44754.1 hypothetical protein CC85DRAFT_283380 [Cutaneotrichosporon oleaginosum]TXT07740.1 hypothetical protein COLE_04664 [Cutaneotrichosporon oleaginosum]
MSPLSQADIDNFFGADPSRSRQKLRPSARPSRSSPPPVSKLIDDSDDDIVALTSPPRTAPRPARASSSRKHTRLNFAEASGGGSDSDIRGIQLSPERKAWHPTSRRVISDDDEGPPVRLKRKAASSSDGESSVRPGIKTRSRARARHPDSGGSSQDSPAPPRRRLRAQRPLKDPNSDSASERPVNLGGRRSSKRAHLDPDDESQEAATEDEDPNEIELDEPERFVTTTRLRARAETQQQRMLRKLKNRRLNLPSSEDEVDEGEGTGGESEEGAWKYVQDDDDGFISEDDGFDERLMPSEFSLGYAQSQEYKFKIMFQYLLLLVIHGPEVLPLRGPQKEYMAPVGELRAYARSIRDLRVRSQIWRANLVHALDTYPYFSDMGLPEMSHYCHACNRRNQHCWRTVYLSGKRYNPQSHEDIEDGEDDEDDEDDQYEPLPSSLDMGPHCLYTARLYHSLSHWEHRLFRHIRGLYRELLRAKDVEVEESDDSGNEDFVDEDEIMSAEERLAELRGTQLPDENDVNAVLEWMETREYQNKAFEHFTLLEKKARMLGGDDMRREEGPDHT